MIVKKHLSREWIIKVPVGMVINYRDQRGRITDKVQEIWFGPIGE
jgi:hypothetical protein